MMHKSDDYKISAVKYYLKNKDNIRKTCKIFDCKKSTLQRWIQRYNSTKNLTRRNRKSISYKISKPQVNTALDLLKQNEQLTMNELLVDMKNKYPTFDITPQHLGQIFNEKALINRVCGKYKFGYPTREMFRAKLMKLLIISKLNQHNELNEAEICNEFMGELSEKMDKFLDLVVDKNITLRPFTSYCIRYLFNENCVNDMTENIKELIDSA